MACTQVAKLHNGKLQFPERTNPTDQSKLPLFYAYVAYHFNYGPEYPHDTYWDYSSSQLQVTTHHLKLFQDFLHILVEGEYEGD